MTSKSRLPILKRNIWELALEDLDPADRENLRSLDKIDALKKAKVAAEKQRDLCIAKRWKIGRVVIRDVFEKILVWVDKFLEIGDIVMQFDPVHAGLPWACIRIILEVRVFQTREWVDGSLKIRRWLLAKRRHTGRYFRDSSILAILLDAVRLSRLCTLIATCNHLKRL